MSALQQFLEGELERREWTIKEFATRSHLSLSNAYLIVRDGKDNVRQDTFEDIAAALSMTPADLMVAIGKGKLGEDPERLPLLTLVRQVPSPELGLAHRILKQLVPSFSANPSQQQDDSPSYVWQSRPLGLPV